MDVLCRTGTESLVCSSHPKLLQVTLIRLLIGTIIIIISICKKIFFFIFHNNLLKRPPTMATYTYIGTTETRCTCLLQGAPRWAQWICLFYCDVYWNEKVDRCTLICKCAQCTMGFVPRIFWIIFFFSSKRQSGHRGNNVISTPSFLTFYADKIHLKNM